VVRASFEAVVGGDGADGRINTPVDGQGWEVEVARGEITLLLSVWCVIDDVEDTAGGCVRYVGNELKPSLKGLTMKESSYERALDKVEADTACVDEDETWSINADSLTTTVDKAISSRPNILPSAPNGLQDWQ
jgi:hypothetical protein